MRAYYNDIDSKVCWWLEELVENGLLLSGDVACCDVRDVEGEDLKGYGRCSLFAGIGGWGRALSLAGWPEDLPVWTGSCPCQPFSVIGKGKGDDDPRHVWPSFRRLISECRPPVVFGEQVASPAGRLWLSGVRADLEEMGYAVGASDLCAAGVGAPHIRQRLYWVADTESGRQRVLRRTQGQTGLYDGSGKTGGVADTEGGQNKFRESRDVGEKEGRREGCDSSAGDGGTSGRMGNSDIKRLEGFVGDGPEGAEPGRVCPETDGHATSSGGFGYWGGADLAFCSDGKARRIEPGLAPLVDGISGRVGLLRGYGNAIVPQVAAEFIRAYLEAIQL